MSKITANSRSRGRIHLHLGYEIPQRNILCNNAVLSEEALRMCSGQSLSETFPELHPALKPDLERTDLFEWMVTHALNHVHFLEHCSNWHFYTALKLTVIVKWHLCTVKFLSCRITMISWDFIKTDYNKPNQQINWAKINPNLLLCTCVYMPGSNNYLLYLTMQLIYIFTINLLWYREKRIQTYIYSTVNIWIQCCIVYHTEFKDSNAHTLCTDLYIFLKWR